MEVDVPAVARGDCERAGRLPIGDGDVALVGVDGRDALRGGRQRRREHVGGAGTLVLSGRRQVHGDRGHRVIDIGGGRGGAEDRTSDAYGGDAGDGGRQA